MATEEDSKQAEATTRWEVATGDPRLRMVAMEDTATSTASARISTGSTRTAVLSTSPTPKTMTTTGIKTEIGPTENKALMASEVVIEVAEAIEMVRIASATSLRDPWLLSDAPPRKPNSSR